jgi:hypothetical protein
MARRSAGILESDLVREPLRTHDWQLFNLDDDLSERNDLDHQNEAKLRELILLWQDYAEQVGMVLPTTMIRLDD